MNIIETAEKELGVTAIEGGKSNPRVLEYFQKIGQKWVTDDDTYWCAAFVGFVLETCGIRSTRLLNARSYLNWGVSVDKPIQGDVVVFSRGEDPMSGHVSFYHHEDSTNIYCLGGNQIGGKVSIQGYPKSRFLGYRRAITTNAPQAPIQHMDITKDTPQVLKIASVTVSYDHFVNGEKVNDDHPVELTLTDELKTFIKPLLVEEGWNVAVK